MKIEPNWTDKFMAASLALFLALLVSLFASVLLVGNRPDGGSWEDAGNGISWTCTDAGQQILRDNATGSITRGDDARCDSLG